MHKLKGVTFVNKVASFGSFCLVVARMLRSMSFPNRCLRQAHQIYGLFSLDSSYIATLNI